MVKRSLSITDPRQAWTLMDFSRKISRRFGKLRSLAKVHMWFAQMCQLLLEGQSDHGLAFGIQCMKALHQCGLDGGSWETADLMIPISDTLDLANFGGTEQELHDIHAYRKSLKELTQAHQKVKEGVTGSGDDDDASEAAAPRRQKSKAEKAAAKRAAAAKGPAEK